MSQSCRISRCDPPYSMPGARDWVKMRRWISIRYHSEQQSNKMPYLGKQNHLHANACRYRIKTHYSNSRSHTQMKAKTGWLAVSQPIQSTGPATQAKQKPWPITYGISISRSGRASTHRFESIPHPFLPTDPCALISTPRIKPTRTCPSRVKPDTITTEVVTHHHHEIAQ